MNKDWSTLKKLIYLRGAVNGGTPKPTNCIEFSAPAPLAIKCQRTWDDNTPWNGVIEYSVDGQTWTEWNCTRIAGKTIYMRGTGNTHITNNNPFEISGTNVSVSGNIETLLDYAAVEAGQHPLIDAFCFNRLFYNTPIITAPELPATTLAQSCYSYMFSGCTSLTTAPRLPATTLAAYCYSDMFSGCTSLTDAPELPATNLAEECYSSMFSGCTSLTTAPSLPATNLAKLCYYAMFRGCTSLTKHPDLPATTLAQSCYYFMFNECTALSEIKMIQTAELPTDCCGFMYGNAVTRTNYPTPDCIYPYKLPATGTATYTGNPASGMFDDSDQINQWGYLDRPVVYPAGYNFAQNNVSQGHVAADGSLVKDSPDYYSRTDAPAIPNARYRVTVNATKPPTVQIWEYTSTPQASTYVGITSGVQSNGYTFTVSANTHNIMIVVGTTDGHQMLPADISSIIMTLEE